MNAESEQVTFADAIQAVSDHKLKTLTQPLVPFLSYWREERVILERLFNRLGMNPVKTELLFEYTVPCESSVSASTDLMLLSDELAVAFHAICLLDHRETTVEDWILKGDRELRERAVQDWVEMIRPVSRRKLGWEHFQCIPVSLLQSTAAVCAIPAQRQIVNVQAFVEGGLVFAPKELLADVAFLSQLVLPAENLEFHIDLPIWIFPNKHYSALMKKLERTSFDDTPELFRKEIAKHSLFKFEADGLSVVYKA